MERAKLEEALATTGPAQGAVHAKEEEEVPAEVDDDTVPASKSKGTGSAKAKAPKTTAATTTTTTSGATTRATRSKTPARAATPTEPTPGSSVPVNTAAPKDKLGTKTPTARKRKATETIDTAETSQPEGHQTKRQTRQALAVQEQQRKEEASTLR